MTVRDQTDDEGHGRDEEQSDDIEIDVADPEAEQVSGGAQLSQTQVPATWG